MEAVTVVTVMLFTSPLVEDVDVCGGAARGRGLHAQLLPEGAARARETRVCPVRSPADQDQGTFCSKGLLLPEVTAASLASSSFM